MGSTSTSELLCEDCERKLNHAYDKYGMDIFRGHLGSVAIHKDGIDLLRVDRRRLRMFFLSVLWRVSVSSHPNYSNIDLPYAWEEDLRAALESGRSLPDSRYTVALYKMRDSTPVGGFDNESLRGFIATPFGRSYGVFISVCFPFLGFFVEVFLPKVPAAYARRRGVISGRSPVLSVPYVEVTDIPEFMQTMVSALRKHREGVPGAA